MSKLDIVIMCLAGGLLFGVGWYVGQGPEQVVAQDQKSSSSPQPVSEIAASDQTDKMVKDVTSPYIHKIESSNSLMPLGISRSKLQRQMEQNYGMVFEKTNCPDGVVLRGEARNGGIQLVIAGTAVQDDVFAAMVMFAIPWKNEELAQSLVSDALLITVSLTPDWNIIEAVQWYADNAYLPEVERNVAGYCITMKISPVNAEAGIAMIGITKDTQ